MENASSGAPKAPIGEKPWYDGLDLLKALAICFVVIFHYNSLNVDIIGEPSFGTFFNYAFSALFILCVPLFFTVNGALLLNRPFDAGRHIRRTLRLVGLVFLWGVVTLVTLALLHG